MRKRGEERQRETRGRVIEKEEERRHREGENDRKSD